MANRRFGNSGPQRGNVGRSFAPSSNINPWQGGIAPGNTNDNIQNQLALALTSLIKQTQQQPSNGPPSLLSMNTSPGFFNQDQSHNQSRFGNRGRQDFRMSDSFQKNRNTGTWRSRGTNFSSKKSIPRSPGKDKLKSDKKPTDKTPTKQDSSAENKEEDSEETEVQEENGDTNTEQKEGEKRPAKATKYDGLPNALLHCFVCNKSMWDGESFQNHIGGKAHRQMILSLEESFQITVNILRENMRLSEERKMIEYDRMQRSRRFHGNKGPEPESHCNMCELKFMGKIVVHRQTEGHQRLKRFLHPKCKRCNLEFPSRMEWVDHQFIPEHLFKLKEHLETKSVEAGEFKLKVQVEYDNEPLLEENMQNEDDSPVLELDEDVTNLFNRIPVYKPDRPVSKGSLEEANGFICQVCKFFMPTEEESQAHLKSYSHYIAFVNEVKTQFQKATEKEKKRKAEEELENAKKLKIDGAEVEAEVEADVDASEETKDDKAEVEDAKEEDTTLTEDSVKKDEEEKVEEKATPVTPTTRQKRVAAGGVKNGAGPKSKKTR